MPRPRLARRVLLPTVLAAASALITGGTVANAAPAHTSGSHHHASYLGRWNYDQPDRDSGRNVAVLSCPANRPDCEDPNPVGGPLQVPQIGDIVFSETADGGVAGRTDQGCTWEFTRESARRLELSKSQYCFNEIYRVGYTITEWTVTVRGGHLDEEITALSHRHDGDYLFTLDNGSRSRAPEPGRHGTHRRFDGTWEFAPASRETQVNVVITQEEGSGGQIGYGTQTGTVRLETGRAGQIAATTPDGCDWTLVARGNTAQLAPGEQSCELSLGTTLTLTHWVIASDGWNQSTIMHGTLTSGSSTSDVLLGVGELGRTSWR